MGKKKRLREERAKKTRTTSLVMDMGHPVELRSARWTPEGGVTVSTADGPMTPKHAWLETSYERPKGDKVTSRVNIVPERMSFKPEAALSAYEWLLAVDTNTPHPSTPISYASIVQAQFVSVAPLLYRSGIARELVAELHGVNGPAERIGWWLAVSGIVNLPLGARVGVIVDAYLQDIPAINLRQQAIIGEQHLPERIELVYASADKPGDSFANKLLHRADRNAREVAVLATDPIVAKPPLISARSGEFFSHIRVWEKQPAA